MTTLRQIFCKRNNRFVKNLSRDQSGAALVEFSLIAAILLFSILFIIQLGLIHLTTLQLEGATSSMARVVRTGRIDDLKELHAEDRSAEAENRLTEKDVREYVCGQLVFTIDCFGNSRVVIENASEISSIVNLVPIENPFGSEDQDQELQAPDADQYVVVTVFLRSPFSILGNNSVLRAATVMRNEPFFSTSG